MTEKPDHPREPVHVDEYGVKRFVSNGIVEWLFESGQLNLNEIAVMSFPDEDRRQVAQLLGYSVSGYHDLSYAEDEA